MNRPPQQLRTVTPAAQPGASLAALQAERAKYMRRVRAAELLAGRRDGLLMKILESLSRASRERIIGAGYRDLAGMSEADFGAYLARVEAILGESDE